MRQRNQSINFPISDEIAEVTADSQSGPAQGDLVQVQEPPQSSSSGEPSLSETIDDQPQQEQQLNVEACKRLIRDFPTAFDNYKICKRARAAKFLDWLRANRNLCETSEDHYEAFVSNNCGGLWCEAAGSKRGQWEAEYEADCNRGETEDNRQDCKILEKKLNAFNALSCKREGERKLNSLKPFVFW